MWWVRVLTLESGKPGCELAPPLGESEWSKKDNLFLVLVSSSIGGAEDKRGFYKQSIKQHMPSVETVFDT